tara:strand:+ start:261 stop:713 length:453 start_codon:yes stop_codon:yes gene_type:complete
MKTDFKGEFISKAPRAKVFEFLLNPELLSECLPDIQSIEIKSPDNFLAKIKVGIGFVKGNFNFDFKVIEKNPPVMAKLRAHGSGTGSKIELETIMELTETNNGKTNMKWKAETTISGMMSGLGQGIIKSTAERMINEIFNNIKDALEKEK